ncbi:hypothetical protein Bdt_1360 [Bdellovibrio bacteriovorus str. Tiberius]|uniref:Peptidase C39-like domain-containing protein n=1 Tax=Bdellovibrio bacteriovorus str. Tiberius TaxID=1069642 RepID=K7YTV0_BDEBC|nr:hypothetical protein Bdt_1360 [Bdellovibrio bacteriovorus str. Tiberius]
MDSLTLSSVIPQKTEISGVPFIEQSEGHCGPATLTMALQWAGNSVSLATVTSQVYTPGMKGSLQTDMISAARRQGMVAVPVTGVQNLLREVRGGHPVIVFENLALSWLPQWHYAIVYGFDPASEEVTMHSGPESGKRWDIRKFERSWKLGDYWGLVVLPPGQLSVTASERAHVTAAAALESLGKNLEAEKAYQSILARWPQSLAAYVGLGNIHFSRKQYSQAIRNLQKATSLQPESAVVWYNLTMAQAALGQISEARKSAKQALRFAAPESKNLYSQNLRSYLDK